MIAGWFVKAYREYEKLESPGVCPDEENFVEMYAALGNKAEQEGIRSKNPEKTHCELLLVSPSACKNCEKNPYREKKEEEEKISSLSEDEIQTVYRFSSIYDYVSLGLINNLSDLSPAEAICVRILHKKDKIQHGPEMMMASLFGGGGKR